MNVSSTRGQNESLRDYQILSQIEGDEHLSQRDLSRVLDMNLATINQVMKRLVRKGCVKTSRINAKRVAYYLTPQGFSEKLRLIMEYTRNTIGFFGTVRGLVNQRLAELKVEHNVCTAAIVGTGELAEAVYLSVQEANLRLVAVYDSTRFDSRWLNLPVRSLEQDPTELTDVVIVAQLDLDQERRGRLSRLGTHTLDMGRLLSRNLTQYVHRYEQEAATES